MATEHLLLACPPHDMQPQASLVLAAGSSVAWTICGAQQPSCSEPESSGLECFERVAFARPEKYIYIGIIGPTEEDKCGFFQA